MSLFLSNQENFNIEITLILTEIHILLEHNYLLWLGQGKINIDPNISEISFFYLCLHIPQAKYVSSPRAVPLNH